MEHILLFYTAIFASTDAYHVCRGEAPEALLLSHILAQVVDVRADLQEALHSQARLEADA